MQPPDISRDFELRDGSLVRIRPIQPNDKERIRGSLQQLSPESRYQRFMNPKNKLSESELRYLTEVDWSVHQAWIAVDPSRPGEPAVGGARCVRLDESNVAELALAVVDSFHGRGLGTLLLGVVSRSAIEVGIDTLRSYVLTENKSMLGILRQLGAHVIPGGGAGSIAIDMPLWQDTAEIPDSPAGKFLKHMAKTGTVGVHPLHR